MVWTPDFRQWRSVVGWKWGLIWFAWFSGHPNSWPSFPCEICCKKVRGKKENNLMFLVSLSLLLLQNFPHVSMRTSSGSKMTPTLLWLLLSVSHLCEEFHTKIPKTTQTHYPPECSQIPKQKTHSLTHPGKKLSQIPNQKRESYPNTNSTNNNNNKIRTRQNKEVSAKSVGNPFQFYPTISS